MTEAPIPYGDDATEIDDDDKVYFAVTVTKRRAEYLYKCLQRPLCARCGREAAECEADPCWDTIEPQEANWERYRPPKFDGS